MTETRVIAEWSNWPFTGIFWSHILVGDTAETIMVQRIRNDRRRMDTTKSCSPLSVSLYLLFPFTVLVHLCLLIEQSAGSSQKPLQSELNTQESTTVSVSTLPLPTLALLPSIIESISSFQWLINYYYSIVHQVSLLSLWSIILT